jgi:surface antigen
MPTLDRPVHGSFLTAALVLWLAGATQSALAQVLTPHPGLAWPGLSQDDVARMRAATARLYEGRSIGTVERWRNPDTGNAGLVKLLNKFDANGMPCRRIEYKIRVKEKMQPQQYVMNWCKTASGDWKIVEPAPSSDTGAKTP